MAELIISEDLEKLLTELDANPQDNMYGKHVFRRKFIQEKLSSIGSNWASISHVLSDPNHVERPSTGWYDMSKLLTKFKDHISTLKAEKQIQEDEAITQAIKDSGIVRVDLEEKDTEYVPTLDPTYVSWGNTSDILAIVSASDWFPVYIVGETGNGKTAMIEQACAKAKREMFRVQINPETDEDDLIGGFRLEKDETVFRDGPVITAMRRGGLLLLDELDRGSNKLMCLQGILEGKPYLIKKTGEVVQPAPGFNVVACANTRGKGDIDGRYAAASIMDEAFLERFPITIQQEYPTITVERRIARNNMIRLGCLDNEFLEHIVRWSDTIRQTYLDGGAEELITTRRLCQLVTTFSVFGDREKAVRYAINRFDEDTRQSFLDIYHAIDPSKFLMQEIDDEDSIAADESDADKKKAKLVGKRVVVTGTLKGHSRDQIKSIMTSCGIKSGSSVSSNTDLLVVGENPGTKKVSEAKSLNIQTMDGDEFLKIIV